LNRLPPATTDVAPGLDWIYICNPYIPRQEQASSESQRVRGCENEAPLDFQTRLGTFIEGGTERLHLLRAFVERSHASRKTEDIINREVEGARNEAVTGILALAHMLHVRGGKWMLFPEPAEVNQVWAVVARATANNELGIAAKVAPRVPETPIKSRLICIYTNDFADKDDIGRVLSRMRELGLVRVAGRPIYYKCGECPIQTDSVSRELMIKDAYTYLGIGSGNAWSIKASLVSQYRAVFG